MPNEIIHVTYLHPYEYHHSGDPNSYGNFGAYVKHLLEYLRDSPLTELVNGDEEGKKILGFDEFEALQAINDLSNKRKIAQMSSLERSIGNLEFKTTPVTGVVSFFRAFDEIAAQVKKGRDIRAGRTS